MLLLCNVYMVEALHTCSPTVAQEAKCTGSSKLQHFQSWFFPPIFFTLEVMKCFLGGRIQTGWFYYFEAMFSRYRGCIYFSVGDMEFVIRDWSLLNNWLLPYSESNEQQCSHWYRRQQESPGGTGSKQIHHVLFAFRKVSLVEYQEKKSSRGLVLDMDLWGCPVLA